MPDAPAPPAPSLAVQIVLYRHEAEGVAALVRSIERAVAYARDRHVLGPTEILIGDSSPVPALTPEQVSGLRASVRAGEAGELAYHFFDANRGSAGGSNELFSRSSSELVLVINPDCYASPSLLFGLCRTMEEPGAGIIEARQIPLEHPKEFDRVTGDTSWASGSCMLIRRTVIDQLNGFDEASFFMYCDDVDFSWRTRLAGFRVLYQPRACVFHDKRLDEDGQIMAGEAEVYYSAEASLMMAWKWGRPDLVERARAELSSSGSKAHRRAVDVFDERRRAGQLPTSFAGAAEVAQFVGSNYAAHRFSYSD